MTNNGANDHRYDAVVFDLLTALLDSWTLWNRAAGSGEAGLRWRMEYLALTYEAGAYRSYEGIIREAGERAGIPARCVEVLQASWFDLKLWPEADAVLDELVRRVPLGVATNSSERLARIGVKAAGERFAAVATAESAGFYKPRPEPYRQVLEKLGVSPERVLFVAGSAADVPGASEVGMPVYWHNRRGLSAVGNVAPLHTERSLEPLLDLV